MDLLSPTQETSSPERALRRLAAATRSQYGDLREEIARTIYRRAAAAAARAVQVGVPGAGKPGGADRAIGRVAARLDRLACSWWGFPLMVGLLAVILWLTLEGANYPSQVLGTALFWLEKRLTAVFLLFGVPAWVHGILVLGIYRNVAWVVSVMLPPMAIFFPCFTLLEDLGYLPRVAFNLDALFRRAGAHGKQSLTMCMGFGCNAAGVVSCRIIDSPRERLMAILTNNFVPCNGRFPLLITLSLIFMGGGVLSATRGPGSGLLAATAVIGLVLLGVVITLAVSWLLSRTVLRGEPSTFVLELPPFRRPQVAQILVRSLVDRTAHVLGRAITIAAPAGALTWTLANIQVGGGNLLALGAGSLDPLGRALGMDGFILTAFLLGLPANETVLPILIMGYLSAGALAEVGNLEALGSLLVARGWTWTTAFSTMLFSLLHFPCGTTLLTIFRETGSVRWTAVAALLPLGIAVAVTFAVTRILRLSF